MNPGDEHALEFLLAFDGRVHHLERGYWLKFEIRRVEQSEKRPHGVSYSFTLHAPDGARVIGFDNAHRVGAGSRGKVRKRPATIGTAPSAIRSDPIDFTGAEKLLDDFFDEVDRVLRERGIGTTVVSEEDIRRSR